MAMKPREERALEALRALLADMARHVRANVEVRLWDGSLVPLGGRQDAREKPAIIVIRDPAAIARVVRKPSLVTLFEVAANGAVDVEGLSPLRAFRRWDHLEVVNYVRGLGARGLLARLWPFLLLPGTPGPSAAFAGQGTRAEVQHHYDVSNAFYRLFLDERMVYSCAWFEREDMTLDEAQAAKLETCCRKLRLQEGMRLLDIGCGWGALAIHAARHHGARVTGITLSEEQHALAVERVEQAGLADRIDIRLADWREVEGGERFDAVVQVGMFEHVAAKDQKDFLDTIYRLLVPGGRYLHHAITMHATKATRRHGPYRKVIDRYIFPGGQLDHIGQTLASIEKAKFEIHDVEGWRRHYARTCAEWHERLFARREEAVAEVGPVLTRTWLLYLAMVAVGFERNITCIFQTVATKRAHGEPDMPRSRADLYREPIVPDDVGTVHGDAGLETGE